MRADGKVTSIVARRSVQRIAEIQRQVADVERANLRGRIADAVRRVTAAGERIRAARIREQEELVRSSVPDFLRYRHLRTKGNTK